MKSQAAAVAEEKEQLGAAAEKWLGGLASGAKLKDPAWKSAQQGGVFSAISISGLQISRITGGRALCILRIPDHLTDKEGNWHAGSIATVIDDVGAAAILSMVGEVKATVDFEISYLSSAKSNEEVEIEAKVVGHKGNLSAVVVEVRKKGSGEMVAIGRQWSSAGRPLHTRSSL